MKTQPHTPTPWKTDGRSIFQPGGSVIAGTVEKSQNAAFIVRAVNAHDEMLTALKFAEKHLPMGTEVLVFVQSAIAKVESL